MPVPRLRRPSRATVQAFGGGLLVALALPPWGWWPLAFVGIAMFEVSLGADPTPRQRLWRGWLFAAAWMYWNGSLVRSTQLANWQPALYDMIKKGFLLAVDDGSLTQGDTPGPGIVTHSVKFVLVDQQGLIRGYYSGEEAGVVDAILPDIDRLLAEAR